MPTDTDCNLALAIVIQICDDSALSERARALALRQHLPLLLGCLRVVMHRLGPALSELARNDDPKVREEAMCAIAAVVDRTSRRMPTRDQSGVRKWLTADGIITMGRALSDGSPQVREHAATALSSLAAHPRLRADLVALDGVRALLDASRHPDSATSAAALRALLPLCADPRKGASSLDSLPVEALLSADRSTVTRTCSWTTPGLCDAFRDLTVLEHLSDVALSEDPEPVREALVCLAALLKDNRPDLERLREMPLASRLLGMARADGLEDPGSIETAAWAVLCRLMSNPTPGEVDSWVDRHATVFETADVLVLSGLRVDWPTLRGSFSLAVDGQHCRRRFALFAGEGPAVQACPPMFTSPMGAPCSYGAVELPNAAYWALQAAVARLFPSLLPYGARTSAGTVVDRETPLAERATNKSAFETTRREVGRRGFSLTVQVRGDEVEPTGH